MTKIRYITVDEKGITRSRHGKKFQYYSTQGKLIKNEKNLIRIKSLRIPPAYENVWICNSATGHIQAYGYDAEGRKQYIYHPQWTIQQTKKKFSHLIEFGDALSKIRLRRRVNHDLTLKPLSKAHSLAVVIRFLEATCIRIGSPQYNSYGLLTLKKSHSLQKFLPASFVVKIIFKRQIEISPDKKSNTFIVRRKLFNSSFKNRIK